MHVAAVIAACICLYCIVCDRDDQTTATEELVLTLAKPVPEQVTLKEGLHRAIDCEEEDLLEHLTTCW